eukprot:scaffold109065_cov75-Phaeocystis_antarctica.AAC.10
MPAIARVERRGGGGGGDGGRRSRIAVGGGGAAAGLAADRPAGAGLHPQRRLRLLRAHAPPPPPPLADAAAGWRWRKLRQVVGRKVAWHRWPSTRAALTRAVLREPRVRGPRNPRDLNGRWAPRPRDGAALLQPLVSAAVPRSPAVREARRPRPERDAAVGAAEVAALTHHHSARPAQPAATAAQAERGGQPMDLSPCRDQGLCGQLEHAR